MNRPERIGIDVGGVIIDRVNDYTDTSFFGDNYLRTTAVEGAFDAIAELVDKKFGAENAFIVSKCGLKTQLRTLEWLEEHRFYEQTGLLLENVHFCRTREAKAPIAVELGLTHFVDDKLEVLAHMGTVARRYLFRPVSDEMATYSYALPNVIVVNEWTEIISRESV